jgi:hypothetical protein
MAACKTTRAKPAFVIFRGEMSGLGDQWKSAQYAVTLPHRRYSPERSTDGGKDSPRSPEGGKEKNMFESNDQNYYLDRERNERALADSADDPSVKAIHEELAARYHGLAVAAEFQEQEPLVKIATG